MKKVKRENKEKIMDMIRKAGSEEYETSWNKDGKFSTSKKKSNVEKGRKSRVRGARFELKVRNDLNSKRWVVDKWMNNIDFEKQRVVPAKRKYNPFLKALSIGTGFPDFIGIKRKGKLYEVIGIEVKRNGWLDRDEKERCEWYLKNKTFSKILIAKAKKIGRKINIEYIDFKKKYM